MLCSSTFKASTYSSCYLQCGSCECKPHLHTLLEEKTRAQGSKCIVCRQRVTDSTSGTLNERISGSSGWTWPFSARERLPVSVDTFWTRWARALKAATVKVTAREGEALPLGSPALQMQGIFLCKAVFNNMIPSPESKIAHSQEAFAICLSCIPELAQSWKMWFELVSNTLYSEVNLS